MELMPNPSKDELLRFTLPMLDNFGSDRFLPLTSRAAPYVNEELWNLCCVD